MTTPALPLVVIGVGNVLLGDDAAGVRVVEGLHALAADEPGVLPPGTRLVDGGTLGLDLLRAISVSRGVVLVDAVRLGGVAGTVTVLQGDAVMTAGGSRDGSPASAVGELVSVARLMGWLPEPVALVGIEVAGIEPGLGLSPVVEGALPAAMDAVRIELRRMDGLPTTPTTGGLAIGPLAGATA